MKYIDFEKLIKHKATSYWKSQEKNGKLDKLQSKILKEKGLL